MRATIVVWRRGWDSNPRIPVEVLLEFQSSAFDHSATSPIKDLPYITRAFRPLWRTRTAPAIRAGILPHCYRGTPGGRLYGCRAGGASSGAPEAGAIDGFSFIGGGSSRHGAFASRGTSGSRRGGIFSASAVSGPSRPIGILSGGISSAEEYVPGLLHEPSDLHPAASSSAPAPARIPTTRNVCFMLPPPAQCPLPPARPRRRRDGVAPAA
jgi:hypothetical protein